MDRNQFKQLQASYLAFTKTELGIHYLRALQTMRETKLSEAERSSDPMEAAFLLQQAKGVKMVIEYFNSMSTPVANRKQ